MTRQSAEALRGRPAPTYPRVDQWGRKPRPTGMPWLVYVMRCPGADEVKIGRSASVGNRARAISNAEGRFVEVLAVIPGYVEVETAVQRRFAHLHTRGEWYRWAPEIEEWVERARAAYAGWEALAAEAGLI